MFDTEIEINAYKYTPFFYRASPMCLTLFARTENTALMRDINITSIYLSIDCHFRSYTMD